MKQQDESDPELKQVQTEFPSIPDIEIIEPIGRGGMAQVFKARQLKLDRIVAVKVLSKAALAGSNGIDRFQQEAKLCSSLDNPVIVKTLAYGLTKNEEPYLILEYLDGTPLSDEIAKNAPLTFRRFQSIFIPLLSALQKAHSAGIVHRDIKPANIMICHNNDNPDRPSVKLLDFGIAKLYDDKALNLTRTGTVVGSPSFMSPEQCQNASIDGRSDIYSLCCVMYMALSGEVPFKGDSAFDTMLMHVNAPAPTAAEFSSKMEVPIELAKLITWGLAKRPADRPATANDFSEKLNSVLNDITLDKAPKVRSNGTSKHKKTWITIAAISMVTVCVLGLATFFGTHSTNSNSQPIAFRKTARSTSLARAKQYISDAHRLKEEGKSEQALSLAVKAYNLLGLEYQKPDLNAEFAHQDLVVFRGVASVVNGLSPDKGSFNPERFFVMMMHDGPFLSRKDSDEIQILLTDLIGSEGNLHLIPGQMQSSVIALMNADKSGVSSKKFLEKVRQYIDLENGSARTTDLALLHISQMEWYFHFQKFPELAKLQAETRKELMHIYNDPSIEIGDKLNVFDSFSGCILRAEKSEEAIEILEKAFQLIEKMPLTKTAPGTTTNILNNLVIALANTNRLDEAERYIQKMENIIQDRPNDYTDSQNDHVRDIRVILEGQKKLKKSAP